MAAPDSSREELAASVAARRELGPDYEDAVLDTFLERMQETLNARVDAQVKARTGSLKNKHVDKDHGTKQFVLGLVSLGTGVPITAIAGGVDDAGVPGIIVAWLGIVGVNVAHALTGRRG
jgi:hypothetical protein